VEFLFPCGEHSAGGRAAARDSVSVRSRRGWIDILFPQKLWITLWIILHSALRGLVSPNRATLPKRCTHIISSIITIGNIELLHDVMN